MSKPLYWFALTGALACKDTEGPVQPGPTLAVANRAYESVCAPVCMPATTVDPLIIGIWPTAPSDSALVVLFVPFDSTRCVRLPHTIGQQYGWNQVVMGASTSSGVLYFSGSSPTDLSGSPGWLWTIRDSVTGTYSVEHHATFAPAAACENPSDLP